MAKRGNPDEPIPGMKSAQKESDGKPARKPPPVRKDEPSAALRKLYCRLREKDELRQLHDKHYHMTTKNFRRRTSALQLPEDIYEKYEEVVKSCPSCQKYQPAPQRSRVTGMRANNFGDLWFVDHVDISVEKVTYTVLVVVDAATNFVWAAPQKNKVLLQTIRTQTTACDDLNCVSL